MAVRVLGLLMVLLLASGTKAVLDAGKCGVNVNNTTYIQIHRLLHLTGHVECAEWKIGIEVVYVPCYYNNTVLLQICDVANI
ncbi:hypothetical protein FRX31_002027 [Thalictrum thalictroides]|uniref:Uncharacterized protein n=1 Tax=Thalictrum thalictroides TaxID=46969 RepID=A0A7J6XGY5_THATH|nr:hypothetical protein FRX31_002027 [Thalictrum thalictroides]